MCGVFAACDFDESLDAELALRAVERLRHRGPDEANTWCNPQQTVSLAHSRLSLVGLGNGLQPLSNESHTVNAVVNGEFYGHKEIRRELVSRGHQFSTESDSEILIHLYEEYGTECLQYLRGEFAFVLWDQNRERMIAVRDRFGVKPLVYSVQGQRLLVASESRALLPEMKPAWDENSFFFASTMQYLPPDSTLFESVRQVPPGGIVSFDREGLRQATYWELDFPRQSESNFDDANDGDLPVAIEEVRRRLTDAVEVRLQADVPVCFHLSGGLDSSAILGIASRLTGQRLHAFTLCFDDDLYDESELAEQTANHCQAIWHPVYLSRIDVLRCLEDAVIGSEGLAINGHLSAKYLLNKAIHDAGFKAVLSGEGADELFAGYAHLRVDYWGSGQNQFDSHELAMANISQLGMMLPYGSRLPLGSLKRTLGYEPAFLQAKATLGYRVRSLIYDHWPQRWSFRDGYSDLLSAPHIRQQLRGRSPLQQSMWLWTRLALAGYIFRTLGDGTEMPWSVEGRVPFVDHGLFEYVRNLPTEYLIRNKTEKFVLREAVRPLVTPKVYARQKHPLDAPPLLTCDSILFDAIRQQIESDEFRQQPFFDSVKVVSLLDSIPQMSAKDKQAWDPVLMMVLSTISIQKLMNNCQRNR